MRSGTLRMASLNSAAGQKAPKAPGGRPAPHASSVATLARMEGLTAVTVLLDRCRELRRVDGVRYPPIPGSLGHQPIPAVLVPRGGRP